MKKTLEESACDLLNDRQPSSYVTDGQDDIDDLYSDVINCQSKGKKIDCIFYKKFGTLF